MKTLCELEPLRQLLARLLRTRLRHRVLKLDHQFREIDTGQQVLHRSSTHPIAEAVFPILFLSFPELDFRQQLPARERRVHRVDDDVILIIDHPFQLAGRHIEHQPEAARHALVEPDVAHRNRQFNVAHALAAHAAQRHFNTAAVADHTLVLDPLVLAAGTFPVARRSEDPLAEQAALLGLECAVVDGFRVLDLAAAPAPDRVRSGDRDRNVVKSLWAGVSAKEFSKLGFDAHEWEKVKLVK